MCLMKTLCLSNAFSPHPFPSWNLRPILFFRQQQQYHVYKELLALVPSLQNCLADENQPSEQYIVHIANLVQPTFCPASYSLTSSKLQKGVNSTQSNDTKSLKATIINWITPEGVPLIPPLHRNQKTDCGFNHDAMGALLCPAGLDWCDSK